MRRQHPDALTARERQVLELIRRGLTNEEIAQRLGISPDGAKYHVSQILSKLGVATREEAAAWRPERQRAGYWKWALIGGLGAAGAIAASALVLAIPRGGNDVQLESGVVAREPDTETAESPAIALTTPRPLAPSQSPAASPLPEVKLPTPVLEFYVDSEPSNEATPKPSSEPTPTPEPVETPRPTECACSGIQGRTTQSPVCPIGCTPAPSHATVAVWNADRTQQVVEFTTDQQGRFRVPLAEGQYYIDPQGPAEPLLVTVPANGFVEVGIDYDTGIR